MNDDYKNRDYTLRGGKDAAIANKRQSMAEAQHSNKDAFVKASQAKTAPLGGKAPILEDRYMKFDACMINNGAHAQEFGIRLTEGLDKRAFPVRGSVDRMEE